jgi:hypothetical protein
VEAKGLEPSNLLTASQALYQLSYAPGTSRHVISPASLHSEGGRFVGVSVGSRVTRAASGTVTATDEARRVRAATSGP